MSTQRTLGDQVAHKKTQAKSLRRDIASVNAQKLPEYVAGKRRMLRRIESEIDVLLEKQSATSVFKPPQMLATT